MADPTLETQPAELALCHGVSWPVEVLARNPSGAPLTRLELSSISATRADVSATGGWKLAALPDGAAHRFLAAITAPEDDAFLPGNLIFRLEYRAGDALKIISAPISLKRASSESASQVARLDLKVASGAVSDASATAGYVAVTNLSNHHLKVKMNELKSENLTFKGVGAGAQELSLEPGKAASFPFTAMTESRIDLKGKRTLVGSSVVSWKDGGCDRSGTLLATQELDVGISVEAGMLTVLGVPTLLVLPGFLVVTSWSLLWARGWNLGSEKPFPLPAKSGEFWFFAISVSLVIMVLHKWFSSSAYWSIYSLDDIFRLWGFSTLGAGLLHGAAHYTRKIALARRIPSRSDGAKKMLEKLSRADAAAYLPEHLLDGKRCFIFPKSAKGGKVWVFPPLVLNLAGDAEQLEKQIQQHRKVGGKLEAILRLLVASKTAWRADWVGGGLPGPIEVEDTKLVQGMAAAGVIDSIVP